ncbi:hypothetical protein CYMTET_51506 [Cymbomonas tetramitiformis]|uniref:Uncharacterized protein n=1 Tax=Cymbomonas tetramitiformis TaxID=36881 RepID=A0AAE0BKW8_9CHLO|nr:hypothetical protein CYMTET_51506 [Cymbomonas tetramitiformis]
MQTEEKRAFLACAPSRLSSVQLCVEFEHSVKPSMDPRDDGLADDEMIEGQNELIITLRDEIRALNDDLFSQKTADVEFVRARQKEEKKLEDCIAHVAQKLEEQKVIHKHELETLSSTKQYLSAAQEENDAMKSQLERLDHNKRQAWGAVGRKNLRIQELRRRIFEEKALVKDERKCRRQVEAARESMRLRTLRPLQFRNLEMVYRLQCKEEWASDTLAQCQDAYEELQANKELQLEAQKKSRQTVREIRDLERKKVFKHCLVDHLTAESNEVRDEYEKLEQEHAEMRENLERIQQSLELARRTEEEVKVQLTHEGTERARLEVLLDERSALVVEHRKELHNIKARPRPTCPLGVWQVPHQLMRLKVVGARSRQFCARALRTSATSLPKG